MAQFVVYNQGSPELSAFGELVVAPITPIASWLFPYNINDDIVTKTETNSATVTHSGSFAVLTSGTNSAGSAKIETRKALRYQPGVGGVVRFTAIFDVPQPNSYQIIGIGDDLDGIFLGYVGEVFGFLRRRNGTEYFVASDNFNVDSFQHDPTKLNVYQLRFQWLGGGQITASIERQSSGRFEIGHRLIYANTETDVTFRNPSLPLMAECKNDGNTTSLVMKTPSGMAGIEGEENDSLITTTGLSVAKSTVSTEVPIVSFYNNTTFQSIQNRIRVVLALITFAVDGTQNATVTVYRGGNLTGASFANLDTNRTPIQVDTTASAFSGGRFLIAKDLSKVDQDSITKQELEIDIVPGEYITITAKSASGTDVNISVTIENLL